MNYKKVIDNKKYCHKMTIYVEDDDYAILQRYAEWVKKILMFHLMK